jgi:hypothetical protein
MLFVSQKVIDIKLLLDLPDLARTMGKLRDYLQKFKFIPGDKFTGKLTLSSMDKGNLKGELTGSSLSAPAPDDAQSDAQPAIEPAIHLILPLGLADYDGKLHILDIFGAVEGTLIEDGGNIQNMLLNTLVLAEVLSGKYPSFNSQNLLITAASSSHPFERLDRESNDRLSPRVNVYPLKMPDRFGIHIPYERGGGHGTFGIISQPEESYEPLRTLLDNNAQFAKAFLSATSFVSSDPFFHLFPTHAMLPYAYVINASTAFRALVAVNAYGTNALLPMNKGEAGEVCKLMLSRAHGTELEHTETPRFPSPLTIKEDGIDPDSLKTLDSSIDLLSRYNPFFRHAEGLSFACPISFDRDGGLIIGMNKEAVACFTSVLGEKGEQHLFDEYSFSKSEQIHETGAGDSVAAIVALFNTVSPEVLIAPHLEGREKTHKELCHLASTVFVSCLSRIVGNLLIRTSRTNLTHIQVDLLANLIQDVAEESVKLARKCVRLLPEPVFGVIEKWDIKVAMWVPRRIIVPTGIPVVSP